MDQIKECFWCDELIQNDEKFVTLKFIGKTSPFEINFHLNHYTTFAFWLEEKTQFEKDYKFEKFSKLSGMERHEEEHVAKEQGLGREFQKDFFNLFNVLIYDTI